jgi:hypothetical protein
LNLAKITRVVLAHINTSGHSNCMFEKYLPESPVVAVCLQTDQAKN